jgi:50S ribosomal protein L16 3-hydroxylase
MCDADTDFVAGQPLKLLPDMDVNFDEVLAPGDLLYVPPGLSHYGVAEDDCLTFSFGFRMPNVAEMMDRVSDKFADDQLLKNPLKDILRDKISPIGQITQNELEYLKTELLAQLQNPAVLEDALMSLMSEAKYPENIPEAEAIGTGDLEEALDQGYSLMLEPASRLLYTEAEGELLFWANGEGICISEVFAPILKQLADGGSVLLDDNLYDPDILEDIVNLLNESILMLLPAEDED